MVSDWQIGYAHLSVQLLFLLDIYRLAWILRAFFEFPGIVLSVQQKWYSVCNPPKLNADWH
jgi:hypothetical protein